jgi:hypothetical protein
MKAKANILDRAIGIFSPKSAAQRIKYRTWYSNYIEGAGYSPKRRFYQSGRDSSDKLVGGWIRSDLAGKAERLYHNIGEVKGIVRDKATFSVTGGFEPQCRSLNRAWAKMAEEWFVQWAKVCDISNPRVDFWDHLWMTSVDIDVTGDTFYSLTYGVNRYPLIQAIRGWRVRDDGKGTTTDGVILSPTTGRPVAYMVAINDTEFITLPAAGVWHCYDPEFPDQTRGLTSLASGVATLSDILDIRDYEKVAVKTQSAIAVVKKTTSGEAEAEVNFDEDQASTAGPKLTLEQFQSGEIPYLNLDESIEAFNNNRPSPAWSGFMKHLLNSVYDGMDWADLRGASESANGVGIRVVLAKLEKSVKRRQDIIAKFATRCWLHAISGAVITGQLPKPPTDWWAIDWSKPPRVSIDMGHDNKNDLEAVQAGLMTDQTYFAKRGQDYREQYQELATEEAERSALGIERPEPQVKAPGQPATEQPND